MTRSKHRSRALLSIGTATSLLFLTACGSDDDDSSAPADADTTEAPAASEAPVSSDAPAGTEAVDDGAASVEDPQVVCDSMIEIDQTVPAGTATKEGANALLDTAIAAADAETAAILTDLQTEVQPVLDDPETEPSEAFFGLYNQTLTWIGENCDVETIDVVAQEYSFSGLPDEVEAGYNLVNFTNDGTEAHELVAVRINDDVDLSIEELIALPEEEADSMITFIGATFAPPGETAVGSLNLSEPGRYGVVCFVPVGSVGETEGDGPPHAMEGMTHEMTVT